MLLTASNRLARILRARHDDAQRQQGRSAWTGAEILPWSAWLEQVWSEFALSREDAPPLLDAVQEAYLWRLLVREWSEREGSAPLSVAATAAEAAEAWRLLHEYRLEIAPEAWESAPDPAVFYQWQAEFRQRLNTAGWISAAQVPDALARRLERREWQPPRRVELAGFRERTPAQARLVEALERDGAAVTERPAPPAAAPGNMIKAGFADVEAEIRAAARWARAALEAGVQGTIAVVVPGLYPYRLDLERIFADVLTPSALLPGEAGEPPFNLALPPPLASWPLAQTAVALLRLAFAPLPFHLASRLLLSPYWSAGEKEWLSRSELERDLRDAGAPTVSLQHLLRDPRGAVRRPSLTASLRRMRTIAGRQPKRQGAGAWADAFAELLAAAHWPGERPLDSAEFQTADALRDAIAALARLEPVAAPLSSDAALEELEGIVHSQLFQPEAPESPVQILGINEAAGLEFARLWVMGLDADSWPGPARPPALLPPAVRLAANLPHCSAQWQHAFAVREQARWRDAAPEVVLSFPRTREDVELTESPLLAGLPEAAPGVLESSDTSHSRQLVGTGPIEWFEDEAAGPADAKQEYPGGAGLIADQAACPFRGFAHARLQARGLGDAPHAGLDASDRGKLAHRCMQLYGLAIKDGHAVEAQTIAEQAIKAARDLGIVLHPVLEQGERERLRRMLTHWIEAIEPEAPPIVEIEKKTSVQVDKLKLALRIDRMDRVSDGEIVIDYKTGEARKQAWESERPDEPQVPLYAGFASAQPVAAAFARLKPGKEGFEGWADRKGRLPGVEAAPRDWADHLEAWRTALKQLAREFLAGDARIAPKHGSDTCRFCDLGVLCRVAELEPPAAAGDDGEEEA